MVKRTKRKNYPISQKDVDRALYLDFEGRGKLKKTDPDPPPSLVGVLCEGYYEVFVLDSQLSDLTHRPYIRSQSIKEFCEQILDRAKQENRRLICWSWYDFKVFEEKGFPPGNIGYDVKIPFDEERKKDKNLHEVYQKFRDNVKLFRKKSLAVSRKKTLRPKAHSLLTLVAAGLGLSRPGSFGAGLVGRWLRSILDQSTKDSYLLWSVGTKKNVTKLLKHNCHDCVATQYVLKRLLNMNN